MPVLSIKNNKVSLNTGAVAVTDTFQNGVLTTADGDSRAVSTGGDEFNNGLLLTDAGQVRYVDATASLPANTVYTNGLPRSGGALCISTDAFSTYSNGTPFSTNGAVAVEITT